MKTRSKLLGLIMAGSLVFNSYSQNSEEEYIEPKIQQETSMKEIKDRMEMEIAQGEKNEKHTVGNIIMIKNIGGNSSPDVWTQITLVKYEEGTSGKIYGIITNFNESKKLTKHPSILYEITYHERTSNEDGEGKHHFDITKYHDYGMEKSENLPNLINYKPDGALDNVEKESFDGELEDITINKGNIELPKRKLELKIFKLPFPIKPVIKEKPIKLA